MKLKKVKKVEAGYLYKVDMFKREAEIMVVNKIYYNDDEGQIYFKGKTLMWLDGDYEAGDNEQWNCKMSNVDYASAGNDYVFYLIGHKDDHPEYLL